MIDFDLSDSDFEKIMLDFKLRRLLAYLAMCDYLVTHKSPYKCNNSEQ